jgi:hypothetical protein
MAKKVSKKQSPKVVYDAASAIGRLVAADGLGKASKAAVRDAVKAIRKADRVAQREAANADKNLAKRAAILEKIAAAKAALKSL